MLRIPDAAALAPVWGETGLGLDRSCSRSGKASIRHALIGRGQSVSALNNNRHHAHTREGIKHQQTLRDPLQPLQLSGYVNQLQLNWYMCIYLYVWRRLRSVTWCGNNVAVVYLHLLQLYSSSTLFTNRLVTSITIFIKSTLFCVCTIVVIP